MSYRPTELINVEQAAAILGVTDSRVRQLLIAGRLIGRKLGTIWVMEYRHVVEFAALDRPVGHAAPKKIS